MLRELLLELTALAQEHATYSPAMQVNWEFAKEEMAGTALPSTAS